MKSTITCQNNLLIFVGFMYFWVQIMNREYDNSLVNFSKYLWNIFFLKAHLLYHDIWTSSMKHFLWWIMLQAPTSSLSHELHQNKQQMFQKKSNLKVKYQCSAFFCGWIILWKVIQKNQVIFHEEVLKFRCELTYCNGYSSFNG